VRVLASTWGDVADGALAFFLVVIGIALGYAFFRIAGTFSRLSTFVGRTEKEVLPVIEKVGGTVDRVNQQLDKVDQVTDSAVDAVNAVDTAVRTVSRAVSTPVKKLAGFASGIRYGAADFRRHRDVRGATDAGKEAAARREHDLDDELRQHDEP
jgi:hypothetical protein